MSSEVRPPYDILIRETAPNTYGLAIVEERRWNDQVRNETQRRVMACIRMIQGDGIKKQMDDPTARITRIVVMVGRKPDSETRAFLQFLKSLTGSHGIELAIERI